MSGKGVLLGVLGGIAGFVLTGGNPAGAVVGFALGMGVGMAMDATTADAPDTPGQSQINKMDIPTCNFGDPLPDFVGTVKAAGNIIQVWGHRVVEITEQQSTPGGKGGGGGEDTQTVVVGYKNYLSWLHAFTYGPDPATTLYTVLFDEKVVYYGTLTDDDVDGEETIQLGDPSGEALGSMTFYFGRDDQAINTKAAAALADSTLATAYRGLVYAHFDNIMIGAFSRAPSVKVVIGKHPSIAAIGDDVLAVVNTLDYNPAFAIWYLTEKLTGISTSFLNASSFTTSANYFKYTDRPGVGVSMFINRQVTAETYIEAIMSHVGATLVEIDGELNLGVLRDDVDESAMATITDTESLDIPSLTIGSWEDTFNDVKISYSKVNHQAPPIFLGEIGLIDSFEFDADGGLYNRIVQVYQDVYVINYYDPTGSANFVVATVSINSNGTINKTVIDSWVYPVSQGSLGGIVKVGDNVFCLSWCEFVTAPNQSKVQLGTFTISNTGVITKSWIDSLVRGSSPCLVHHRSIIDIGNQTFAVAYHDGGAVGLEKVFTIGITTSGVFSAVIDEIAMNSVANTGGYGYLVEFEPNIPRIGYHDLIWTAWRYDATNRWMQHKLLRVESTGMIQGIKDSIYSHTGTIADPVDYTSCAVFNVPNFDGFGVSNTPTNSPWNAIMKTISISLLGNLILVDTKTDWANGWCSVPWQIPIAGQGFAFNYGGSDGLISADLLASTIEIGSDGTIGDQILELLIDDIAGGGDMLELYGSSDIYIVAYSGSGYDGWLATLRIR